MADTLDHSSSAAADLRKATSVLGSGSSLHWRDLTVKLPPKKPPSSSAADLESGKPSAPVEKHILDHVSGYVLPGEILFIMGPSGSGKTTLLDALADRLKLPVRGHQHLDGVPKTPQSLRIASKYVQQQDNLLGVLTVQETLDSYAGLYIPDASARAPAVAEAMDILGLTDYRDTKIGNAFTRGLSGGQVRRVSIGAELVASPNIMFLDEPTSGLDSATAFHVMSELKRITKRTGKAMVITVHQPSQLIFEMADNLLLLTKGKQVYFGRASEASGHFTKLGFIPTPRASDIDWMLDLINQDFGQTHVVEQCIDAWPTSNDCKRLEKILDDEIGMTQKNDVEQKEERQQQDSPRYNVGFLQQTMVLTKRGMLNAIRNPAVLWLRFAMYVMLSLLIGLVWLRLPFSAASIIEINNALFYVCAFMIFMSISVLPAYLEERSVLVRERANNAYSIPAYILSHTLYEIPYVFILSLFASLVTYYMVGLRSTPFRHFLIFALNLFTSLLVSESMMVLIAAMCPILIVGIAAGAMTNGMFMCVQGAFISIEKIGWWIRWIKFVALHFYSYSTFIVNQHDGLVYPAAPQNLFPPYPNDVEGSSIVKELGLETRLWVNFAAQIAMIVVYRGLAALWLHFFVKGKK